DAHPDAGGGGRGRLDQAHRPTERPRAAPTAPRLAHRPLPARDGPAPLPPAAVPRGPPPPRRPRRRYLRVGRAVDARRPARLTQPPGAARPARLPLDDREPGQADRTRRAGRPERDAG